MYGRKRKLCKVFPRYQKYPGLSLYLARESLFFYEGHYTCVYNNKVEDTFTRSFFYGGRRDWYVSSGCRNSVPGGFSIALGECVLLYFTIGRVE